MTSLFEGKPSICGLSNENELVRICPPEFKKRNAWSEYASHIFFAGANASAWKWKNLAERPKQISCFNALLGGFDLSHEDKIAVAGWMLSEMLAELPKVKR